MNTKVCPICGKEFEPHSGMAVYCSPQCARKAATARNIDNIRERSKMKGKINDRLFYAFNFECAVCNWSLGSFEYGPGNGCEMHHIIPVSEGGTNDESNLVLLCPNCHKLAHTGLITREELQQMTHTKEEADYWREQWGMAYCGGTYWVDNLTIYRQQFKNKLKNGEEI